MKKMLFTLVTMLTIAVSANAMSYEQARREALFLTDKMAYELNLTDAQYEAAYEINLDYLMGVTSQSDVFGLYWERRNLDISYILYSWQWDLFRAATYFYRPLYWEAGYWHFGIYARYPHRDYFYFGRPAFYATYRGAHAWHLHGSHGYYYNYRHHYRPVGRTHFGMLDRWNRGDYRSHHGGTIGRHGGHGGYGRTDRHPDGRLRNQGTAHSTGNRGTFRHGDSHRHSDNFGGPRTSSTRTTVNNDRAVTHSGSFGGSRGSGSFGGSRSSSSSGSVSRGGFGGGSRSGSSHGSGSRSGGSFGSRR